MVFPDSISKRLPRLDASTAMMIILVLRVCEKYGLSDADRINCVISGAVQRKRSPTNSECFLKQNQTPRSVDGGSQLEHMKESDNDTKWCDGAQFVVTIDSWRGCRVLNTMA